MAHDLKISNALAGVEADAAKVRFDNGYLRIYQGTKPTSADDPPTGSTLLAELQFGSPAAASQANGLITMNPLIKEDSAPAGGIADWYRAIESDGTTVISDGTCGLAGGGYDCEMATTTIVIGQEVTCSAFSHRVKKA